MNDMPEHDDINVANLAPPADPALLASANRMLAERLAGVAHTLRGSGLDGLRDISDCENLQQHVAALTGAYQMALSERDKALALVDILKRNLDSKTHECEALRKSLEAAQSRGDDRPIAGYMTADTMLVFQALDEARKQAESAVVSRDCRDQDITVYELRLIGTAKRSAEWVPA